MCVSEHSEMEEGAVTVRDEQRSGRGCGSCSKGLLPAGTLLGGCALSGSAGKTTGFLV